MKQPAEVEWKVAVNGFIENMKVRALGRNKNRAPTAFSAFALPP